MVEGRPKVYPGTLGIVSADNLGSLALGGFKESCSANRMCRDNAWLQKKLPKHRFVVKLVEDAYIMPEK